MKNNFIFLLSFFLTTALFAQTGRLHKADDLYGKLAYAKAIPVYASLLGSSLDSPELKAKLAHCYYQNNNLKMAEQFYSQAFGASVTLPLDHYFFYAQTLKQLGKYSESDQWMLRFHGEQKKDNRGINFAQNTSYLTKILGSPSHFRIDTVFFNSTSADFGGYRLLNTSSLLC